ncbi:MAG: tetratricopeptide repeat protein [Mastigocoleus sp. MO_167.B18]|uniref:tetratricopeptide repeat protein n=1 Tax=Mastigocoleus sp. MO_188.B34 TaxID=3036635 RepID=UPI00260B5600|nr:tetratricopeptide repeat protein [Mastigocoleus sp. MO_188.B34]MDJ0697236.1 tetratricopeptide repeat protein [Mastigocoleus sp. MO_188.B34]MDJ0773506.1 tetratricopeptide repeat protein [Mastigocoleus sp. MO_167.B18]
MKFLKVTSAIVLLSCIVFSQKVSAQTLPKLELEPQIEKLQLNSIQSLDSQENNQKVKAYLNKGIEYLQAKKYSEAIQAFSEVIKIQPNNQYAYLGRGISYLALGKYQQAKTDFDQCIEFDYSLSYAYFFRGITNSALGNKENAIEDLKTATNLFERDGQTQWAQKSRNLINQIRNA